MSKKTSVTLTEINADKITRLVETTGYSQSEIINKAIAEVPIVALGERKMIAEAIFDLLKQVERNEDITKEVDYICQLLNSLTEKIEALQA